MGTIPMSIIAKMTRAGMLEVLQTDYIRTARAKGLSNLAVVFKHGLRNALIPIVTVVGLQTGFLLGGAVLTESIFAWPGVGRLAFEAISNRDYPLINGTILLVCGNLRAREPYRRHPLCRAQSQDSLRVSEEKIRSQAHLSKS